MRPTDERFWSKVDKSAGPEGCWLWTGSLNFGGYGRFMDGGVRDYVHRLSYEAAAGVRVPEGMYVDHKCHVRQCVNPAHLQVVTNSGNMQNRLGPQSNSQAGVRGVHPHQGRWRVRVCVRGKQHSGGLYDNLEDAEAAAIALRNQLMTNNLQDRVAQC